MRHSSRKPSSGADTELIQLAFIIWEPAITSPRRAGSSHAILWVSRREPIFTRSAMGIASTILIPMAGAWRQVRERCSTRITASGPGNGTNISNNDPTTGGQNPSDPNYPSPQQMAASVNQIWDSAQASAASYDMGKTAPPGYSVSQVYTIANNGTDAVLYQNNTTRSYILAYTGTQSMSDAGTDVYNGTGNESTRYDYAVQIAQSVQAQYGNNVILAGHSLGGGEAALASVATGLNAYTFNAAGVDPAAYGYPSPNTSQIMNYHVVGEPVSTGQPIAALGNDTPLPAVTTPTRANWWNHSMSSVISSLSSLGLPAK